MAAESTPETYPDFNNKQRKLFEYLVRKTDEGKMYFKSRFIADEIGLSSSEVGVNMLRIAEECNELSIQKWSYTSATTWRIEKD